MKRELMIAHIEGSTHSDINPVLAKDNSNLSAFFCADVVGGKSFVLNLGGYPRSEIAQINAAVDLNQQINLLQNLEDFSPSTNPNAGLTDAQIMLGHRSKYCQTASEQIGWLQEQMELRASQRAAAELDIDASQQTIKFDSGDVGGDSNS